MLEKRTDLFNIPGDSVQTKHHQVHDKMTW